MSELVFHGVEKLLFGVGSINELGKVLRPFGQRLLLVTEQGAGGNLQLIQDILRAEGIESVIYDDIRAGIKTSEVETIAAIGKAGKIQTVLALGGMRVFSLARIAAVMIGNDISLNAVLQGRIPEKSRCTYVEIPSSCRNHFMFSSSSVISDSVSERPQLLDLPKGLTRAIIIDPRLSMGLSVKYQHVAILDTMMASMEGYLSNKRNFFSDILFIESINLLKRSLTLTSRRPDDLEVRATACRGGLLSSMGLATSGQGIGGTLTYMIHSAYHVPKSWVSMVLMPHILDLHVHKNADRLGRIADAMGEDISGLQSEQSAPMAGAAIRRDMTRLELPTRLRDFNLSMSDLMSLSGPAADFPLNENCSLQLDAAQISELLKKAF